MRLSCHPLVLFKQIAIDHTMSLEEWFAIAAHIGLAGTEVHQRCLRSLDSGYLAGVAQSARACGLAVSQFVCAPDFSHPDPDVRARELALFERHVDAAAALGAFSVRVTAGPEHRGIPAPMAVNWVVECFLACLEYTRRTGVWLTYENHFKDHFWSEPDLSARQAVYLDILNRLSDTDLRVNFDCANPLMVGEDPLALLTRVLPLVVHVHCTDRLTAFEYTHAVPGQGLVDYPALFRAMRQAGYDGWLSIEYNGAEGLDGIRRARTYLQRTWDEARGLPSW